jgi:hypothetical protein
LYNALETIANKGAYPEIARAVLSSRWVTIMIRTLPLTLLLLSTFAVANQGDRYNKEIQNAKNAVTKWSTMERLP